MIVTADVDIARLARLLRNQGMEERYRNEVVGFNARMSDIHAAIGRVQLRRLAGWTQTRQENAARLDASLRGVTVPPVRAGAAHVYHQYTVRTADRAALAVRLDAAGIGYGVYYPVPVHRLPSFDVRLYLPETERAAAEVCSLPVGPHVDARDLDAVIDGVNG